MAIKPSITTWNRVEPRPRAREVSASLRAEIRDPAWLLGRQWQLGEFAGEDAGSPAFADVQWRTAELTTWTAGTVSAPFDGKAPLERQALAEPHGPDQATRVELGQVFFRVLGDQYAPEAIPQVVKDAFKQAASLTEEKGTEFDPLDESTRQFQLIVVACAADGVKILTFAEAGTVPGGIDDQNDRDRVIVAYAAFIASVKRVFGAIGADPPAAWDPQRLENRFTITAGPEAAPPVVLAVQPDADGRLEWSSFDLASQSSDPFAGPPPSRRCA